MNTRAHKWFVCGLFLLGCLVASVRGQTEDTYINFSFDEVDVRTFVKLVGEISGRRFVVDENVKGKVTVVSPRVSVKDVYPLFVTILESVGCSVVEDTGIHRVVLLPERGAPVGPVVGPDEQIRASGLITKVIHLEHVSANQVKKALDPQGGTAGRVSRIAAIEDTNHLVVTDTVENIRALEKIISEVDREGLSRITEIVTLKFADAGDLADELNRALQVMPDAGDRLRGRLPQVQGSSVDAPKGPVVVASAHANSLIVVGSSTEVKELKSIIEKMDVDVPSGRGNLNAVFLKYISADEAAERLNALFGRVPVTGDKKEGATTLSGGSDLSRRIAIEPSVANNALLVSATPGDFEIVKRLVEQLDSAPEQVHIAVMIVEETEGGGLDFGVEMAAVDLPSRSGQTEVQGSLRLGDSADGLMNEIQKGIFPRGMTVGVARGTRLDATGKLVLGYPAAFNVDALRKDSRYNILSETSLESQNNLEAALSIVNEIPILKSTIQGGSGTARDVIQNIERVSVGIKLKLTPHVIPPGDQIRMVLNPVIEAVVDDGPEGTTFAPTIARREVSTTVTVPNGRMIVIAGLTRQDKSKQVKRVPILGSIPLLGWLFRSHSSSEEKTNVLILVTPQVVTDTARAEAVMQEWQKKTGLPVAPDDK